MNGEGDELEQLLHSLRTPVAMSDPDEVAAQRERLLPALRARVEHVPVRARRIRFARKAAQLGFVGLSAAACFTLGLKLFAPPALPFVADGRGQIDLESLRVEPLGAGADLRFIEADGNERALPGPAALRESGELVSGAAQARVSTTDGVQIELAAATRVRLTTRERGRARPPLHLVSGAINCRVPPLGRSDSFSVMTPTAQVIVHGTVFSVRVDDGPEAQTCVQVERGLVEVRHRDGTTYLGSDSRWGCEPPLAARAPNEAAAAAATRSLAEIKRARSQQRPSGTLEQEIELLSSALSAEQKRDQKKARALFAELLGRYPHSPLVPEARAGLTRSQ